jgi:phage tail tape-measure protein
MTRSKMLTALIAIGAVVLTSAVTPASARRGIPWRGAAVAAGVAAAAAAASGGYYYSGYGYGRYGHYGRCGGGAYC